MTKLFKLYTRENSGLPTDHPLSYYIVKTADHQDIRDAMARAESEPGVYIIQGLGLPAGRVIRDEERVLTADEGRVLTT